MKGLKLISKLLIVAGLVMVLTGGMSVFAATGTGNQTLSFTNALVASVTVGTTEVDFAAITPDTPATISGGTVTGSSNGIWNLSVAGTNFTNADGTLALQDHLMYRIGGSGAYSGMTAATSYPIASGHAIGSQGYAMDFQLTVPTSLPGSDNDYTATLTYTISNN